MKMIIGPTSDNRVGKWRCKPKQKVGLSHPSCYVVKLQIL